MHSATHNRKFFKLTTDIKLLENQLKTTILPEIRRIIEHQIINKRNSIALMQQKLNLPPLDTGEKILDKQNRKNLKCSRRKVGGADHFS